MGKVCGSHGILFDHRDNTNSGPGPGPCFRFRIWHKMSFKIKLVAGVHIDPHIMTTLQAKMLTNLTKVYTSRQRERLKDKLDGILPRMPKDGVDRHESLCYVCKRGGRLLMCEYCERVSHFYCVDIFDDEVDDYICDPCVFKALREEKKNHEASSTQNQNQNQNPVNLNLSSPCQLIC